MKTKKKHLSLILGFALLLCAFAAPSAGAAFEDYGIASFGADQSSAKAGAHPDLNFDFEIKSENSLPFATTKELEIELPAGLLSNLEAVPKCSAMQLVTTDVGDPSPEASCPQDSQVGITEIVVLNQGGGQLFVEPIFNMEPSAGSVASFGFIAKGFPIFADARLRSEGDYGATVSITEIGTLIPLLSSKTTIWGVPADNSHDSLRITPYESANCAGAPCTAPGEAPRHSSLIPIPFMVNPTRCGVAHGMSITATPYPLPNLHVEAFAPLPPITSCGLLGFEPEMSVAPTSSEAESAVGLDVELSFASDGYEHPNLPADSQMKRAEVTLPEGVTVNPSQAEGLGVCSEADFARETATSGPNVGCPETAKIGTVSAKSPLLDEMAEGALYIAKPYENPTGSLLAIYLVLKIPDRGVIVKLAGKVAPDPRTGQLVTTFEDLPQLPVSTFKLHFREGARSPLVTPPRCGTYETVSRFTPWSDPSKTVTTISPFQITSGTGHGPCPQGSPPFRPGFGAGTINNNAGSYSPFYMRLIRRDGDQDLTRFSAELAPGMVAKLAGTTYCPEAAIAASKAKTGKAELASPSCPASSEVGHTLAGAGVGSVLTYVPGKVYLAGPFGGAPLSVVAITPAVAGPFDVGTVVVRQALQIDRRTAKVRVDGAHSDPIPHILAGIPLKVRDIRVYVERPEFTLNPTSCDPFSIGAQLWGGGTDVFSTADDAPASLAERFQAANCASLGFKPRLDLKLVGGTARGDHPALRGTYTPRPGDANVAGMVLRFPHSAFLDQGHIRTICTRVQFAAEACPAGAVYGKAVAYSPLLDAPLEGPVYLRSSSNKLPDFVADLRGQIDVEAVARIDSKDGGIRATFTDVPDAPLSKVVVSMRGGKKGLIVNSRNLCRATSKGSAELTAQNGKSSVLRPPLKPDCGKR